MRRVALLLTLALAACGETHYRNVNGSYGQLQFDRDKYQCTRENTHQGWYLMGDYAGTYSDADSDMVKACLRARGWYQTAG